MISLEQPMRPALIDVIKNAAGGLTALQLWSDGTEIKYTEESEEALTYAEILEYVQDENVFVTLYTGDWVLYPQYVHGKGGENAIWFSGTTLLNGVAYYYRIIINSENVVRSDEYPIEKKPYQEDEWEHIGTYNVPAGFKFDKSTDANGMEFDFKEVYVLVSGGTNTFGAYTAMCFDSDVTSGETICSGAATSKFMLGVCKCMSLPFNLYMYGANDNVTPNAVVATYLQTRCNSFMNQSKTIKRIFSQSNFVTPVTIYLYAIRNHN